MLRLDAFDDRRRVLNALFVRRDHERDSGSFAYF
jgi:hypothetical protein